MTNIPVSVYSMKQELYEYDIYPKVFLTGSHTVTVRPLGDHVRFAAPLYAVSVKEVEVAEDDRFAGGNGAQMLFVAPDEDGCIRFTASFPREEMYLVSLYASDESRKIGRMTVRLNVYALAEDMKGRYPLRGDLHLHSCRSDGHECPAAVIANYRGHGYDFTVLSDHGRYFPSLEARRLLHIEDNEGNETSDLTDFLVVPGEEVHLPLNPVHYVNFGGRFSINALVTPSANEEGGSDLSARSLMPAPPAPMTRDEFRAMIAERAKSVPLELESERLSFAAAQWIYEMQKKAGGIGIFPHPYWLCSTMQLSESYTRFFYEQHPFDAFEVLGGENYYQHNGFQTSFYYEMKAKGISYPVVGSTDSHGSTEYNRNALICSTLVFSPANTTSALCSSIRSGYSVAVDTISPQYRLVGDFRFVKYGSFLLENYFPLHDRLCAAEGTYLRSYLLEGGDTAVLAAMKGQVPAMLRKYFEIGE